MGINPSPCPPANPVSPPVPSVAQASLLGLENTNPVPASGPLLRLFPLPGMLFPAPPCPSQRLSPPQEDLHPPLPEVDPGPSHPPPQDACFIFLAPPITACNRPAALLVKRLLRRIPLGFCQRPAQGLRQTPGRHIRGQMVAPGLRPLSSVPATKSSTASPGDGGHWPRVSSSI